jgi:1-acyl-sn-glycerol-3-phosphate acyltransferase
MLEVEIRCHAPLPGGPKILAANHPTTIDPLLIVLLTLEQISVLVGQSIISIPVLGRYLLGAGHVPLKRRDRQAAVVVLGQLLEAGRTVVIFPEGEISPPEGGLLRPHTGVARLAPITGALRSRWASACNGSASTSSKRSWKAGHGSSAGTRVGRMP